MDWFQISGFHFDSFIFIGCFSNLPCNKGSFEKIVVMQSQLLQFLKKITFFTLIIGLIVVVARFSIPQTYFSPALPFLLLFFYAINIIVFNILIKASKKRANSFINQFMVSSFLKLLLYVIVLSLYVFLNKKDAIPFAISFLLLYILFTVFEVTSLLKNTDTTNN